ncbi:uronyl 2-sulfotransferase-like isoform X2 [Tachypleus tridentatus]|uniref:uronyl 2-sulfotransferase-like isoform X2 n=1 Tax=Tachypleus tridentatus TaxID=6853 RepID=UPI003FD0EBB1
MTGSPANLLKNIQVLLYNRVPKSGGESMIYLIHKISKQNGFNSTSSMLFNKRKLNAKNQKAFIEEMLKIKPPFVYDRHIYFTDFTKFDYPNPLYINIIREPVEKMISRFFFWRMPNIHVYEELKVAGKVKMDKQTWLKKDFKECVLKSDPECTFISGQPYDLTIPYFCGHEDECMILNSEWALEKAKENVEKYYSVVGVLEQMDITIKVMEAYLPQFFRGLFKVHKKTGIVNKTSKKDKVPRRIKEMLKRNLKTEYEFYNFIIDRLHKQYRTLKLKKHQ